MPYFPKNRIIENQQANNGEFTTEDGRSYVGVYYTTFNGKYYTGANPTATNSRPLIKLQNNTEDKPSRVIINDLTSKFKLVNSSKEYDLLDPPSYNPIPTDKDYKSGKITRYFAQQRNVRIFKIIEIDKNTYDDIFNRLGKYNYSMWKVISLFWQITGPLHDDKSNPSHPKAGVIDTNQRILDTKEKTFPGIKQYLNNLTQFYKG